MNAEKEVNYISDDQNWEKLIYYGSPSQYCYLLEVDGKFYDYDTLVIQNEQNNESNSLSISKLYCQKHLGEQYKDLYLPTASANEISYICKNLELKNNKIFNNPLIKFDIKKLENLGKHVKFYKGFQSGIRSCIIPLNQNFYRLKGCGNLNQGFITKQLNFRKNGIEIRGCQFPNTSIRELYFSDKIQKILDEYKIKVSNECVGLFYYDKIDPLYKEKLDLKDEKDRITKTCGIYKSLSEKRVGCHLMPGIEFLFVEFALEFTKKFSKNINIDTYQYNKNINLNSGLINNIKGMFIEERWIRKKPYKPSNYVKPIFDINMLEVKFDNEKNNFLKKYRYSHNSLTQEKIITFELLVIRTVIIQDIELVKQPKPDYNFQYPIVELSPTFQHINCYNFENGEKIETLFDKFNIYNNNEDNRHFSKIEELKILITKKEEDAVFSRPYSIFFTESPNLRFENLELAKFILNSSTDLQKSYLSNIISKHWQFNYKDQVEKLFENQENVNVFEITCYLYNRIGWEIGRIKRIFQDKGINWGTYEDLPFRLHCNAHTDNLTIIPPYLRDETLEIPNLLAVLDFDLAFFKENFLSLRLEDELSYCKNDPKLFDRYLNFERQHLEWELSGMENMNIFMYIHDLLHLFNESDSEVILSGNFNIVFNSIIYFLRDHCLLGYQDGYMKREFKYSKEFKTYYKNINELITIGLYNSHDFLG